MPKPRYLAKADVGKTKQQLADELVIIRRKELLLSRMVEIATDAIIWIDEDQRITLFNQGAEQIFGYCAQEMEGEFLETLLPEQFRSTHKHFVKNFAGSQDRSRLMNERVDIVGLRKDGSTFPARASISRLEHDGRTTLTVILRDVSEIRQAEASAAQRREEVAHMARVGLLAEVAASLAHEINQPLAAILANAQALKRQILADPNCLEFADEAVSDVIADARRAAKIIQRMRALMKPGKRNDEVIDFNQIVTETVRLLQSEAILRKTKLTIEVAPNLPAVFGDRIQLQQVLMNLLMNAFDAMEEHKPGDRHLSVGVSQAGSRSLEICVRDSGVGLDDESYQRVFEPFYSTKKGGMGMGLSISKTIVQSHGGKLWAQNNRGPGAAFYFTVPVEDGTDVVAARTHEHEHTDNNSGGVTVCIVDDDASVRKAMGKLIGAAGYAIETFESAQAFLQRERYSGNGCLVVDLHMPGQSGLDLQTMLNTREYTMPIIFMTGDGDTSSGVRAMKQGAMDFLSKPIDDEELITAIACAIEADRQDRDRYTLHVNAKQKTEKLTNREAEIMDLVVSGLQNKQIAATLGITEKTVKVHRGRVMQKVGARSVTDLVRISEFAANSP
jgi:two-component system sensor kinase FixL